MLSAPPRFPPFPSPSFLSRLRLRRRRRRRGDQRHPSEMPSAGAAAAAGEERARAVRLVSILIAAANLGVMVLGLCMLHAGECERERGVGMALAVAPLLACVKVFAMAASASAQHATAAAIAGAEGLSDVGVPGTVNVAARLQIRKKYRRWLWWTRFGVAITGLQFAGAAYLLYLSVNDFSHMEGEMACFLGQDTAHKAWKLLLVVSFLVLSWLVVIIQCLAGSEILRWRSFYSTHDTAWKAHYREVFDHQIREALCCLGRSKYLTAMEEEDEVYSVARFLGDLVAYRASGTGHLELIAGLALLEKHGQLLNPDTELLEAPHELLREASILHPLAEAAYTGPLLDFGRNPVLFPCVWLYRQGLLTAWSRNKRPALQGDNWWRGHAAAFLRFINASPKVLLRGRVHQTKREAAYFVVVLHEQRSVVITVRGTETPEDLLTDGLCRECVLTKEDLTGLLNCEQLPASVREKILSTFPHYGHGGIIESARELLMQLDGNTDASKTSGFLSSLLSLGGDCHGYKIRIVGHSLGGAVATLLGMMLYGRYPDLHVYAFGALPCLDLVLAEACSDFVTTIVLNDEFSSRLSVSSILRLRSAAITAVSDDSSADSAMIRKFARRILQVNKYHEKESDRGVFVPTLMATNLIEGGGSPTRVHPHNRREKVVRNQGKYQEVSLSDQLEPQSVHSVEHSRIMTANCSNYGGISAGPANPTLDAVQISVGTDTASTSSQDTPVEPPEVFLAGLIIHIVQQRRTILPLLPLLKRWSLEERDCAYKALLAKREHFRDIIISPYMFIDHLPWRCQYAMQKVIEAHRGRGDVAASNVEQLV